MQDHHHPTMGVAPPKAESGKRNIKREKSKRYCWRQDNNHPTKGLNSQMQSQAIEKDEKYVKDVSQGKTTTIQCRDKSRKLPEPQQRGLVCQMQSQKEKDLKCYLKKESQPPPEKRGLVSQIQSQK